MTSNQQTPLLAIRNVTTMYGNIVALRGVDLDVHRGEIVTLIGANGAGKSTLMMTICGNPRAREGKIEFDWRDITRVPTHEIARLKLAHRGYVMVNGLITLSGTGRELLERPEIKAAYLEGGRS